jgi:hypothetical protein
MEVVRLQRLLAGLHLRHGADEATRIQHKDEQIADIQGI